LLGGVISVTSFICSQKSWQFFSLMNLSTRFASIIGPNVMQVIINKSGSNWKAFSLLFSLSALAGLVVLFGVDVPKGRHAAAQWAAEKRGTGASMVILDEKDRKSEGEFSESKSGE
jgi:hypothetical protein